MWLIEHWQKLDSDATPEGVLDQLLNLVTVLPVLPVDVRRFAHPVLGGHPVLHQTEGATHSVPLGLA
jgi:hypothetical protein